MNRFTAPLLLGLLCCFVSTATIAQNKFKPKYLRENDKTLLNLTSYASDNGWLDFKQDAQTEAIDPDAFLNRFGNKLGVGNGYHLKPTKDETDFREIRHQTFQLYYKNIKVEGVEYTLHSRHKRLRTAHGRIIEGLSTDVSKPMPERKALEIALADLNINADELKGRDMPKGELVLISTDEALSAQNVKLCYAFDMRIAGLKNKAAKASEPQRIYVDASTGEVVQRAALSSQCFNPAHQHQPALLPLRPHLALPGTGNSLVAQPMVASTFTPFSVNNNRYFGAQGVGNFETEPVSTSAGQQYRLSLPGTNLRVRDAYGAVPGPATTNMELWQNGRDIFNPTPHWGTNHQVGTMALWLTQRIYPFYEQIDQQQRGIDRNGQYPLVVININDTRASWDNIAAIGFGQSNNVHYVTADILGHEYTHAVTQNNSNLGTGAEYKREPGALNESVADIFGTAFERYLFPDGNQTNPSNWNWTLGEDGQGAFTQRSMANPEAFRQPSRYGAVDPNWFPANQAVSCNSLNNLCGVHINSGVMNKWFHTLCTGQFPAGTHAMNAIAFDDAIKIVYRAVRHYTHSTSNYADMRDATASAARDLFFSCSPQHRAVVEAWRLANLPSPHRCDPGCDFDVSPNVVSNAGCNQAITLNATCSSPLAWPCSGLSFSYSGPNVPYNSGGAAFNVTTPSSSGHYRYTVKLAKPGCYTPEKTFHVSVNCLSSGLCDFGSDPRYVGTWYGLTVQIRHINGKNVLVTAITGSNPDKYYPRGDNFWGSFSLDPNAANLQGCLNAGSTGWGGLSLPGGLTPPPGYSQGTEADGAVYFVANGGPPPANPCDFSQPRHVGTWNGLNVQIRQFPNNKRALVTAEPNSSNDKYYPRGDNFWDNFTKTSDAEQYRACLNAGNTGWWGMSFPSISPPGGYQQGNAPDGAIFFSTNGLRKAASAGPTPENVSLVTVRPNPAQTVITVGFVLAEAQRVSMQLLDLQGRTVKQQSHAGVAGMNEPVLNIASLPAGQYMLEVRLGTERIMQKVIKE
ncbi:M4 family metallopeptidase [Spirosoma montaniterrae]|uniref:Uncharacterized protein n=1 Tax=Spirosoma montaniterrae TaxID=1178516 RepID=A0A1P9WS82_9BACT|nr:M4 family metallopeptidase [Spirosoma montaniterrae]AQG78234.1 hypothetical protein AWR27_02055 [Spirosoma montaniterrae]